MKMRKSRGPKIDHCGTPLVISNFLDNALLILTHCFLLLGWLSISFKSFPPISKKRCNFAINLSWETLSKAFTKSK